MLLNGTNAFASSSAVWNSTVPTSTVFSIGTADATNISSETYVAYCFAEVEGFSKMGSYTGNGSTDGTFVYTGFQPAFWMSKRTDSTSSWIIIDNERSTYNPTGVYLIPNSTSAENTATWGDFVSNGFKIRNAGSHNDSGATYIYMAFAENPFKNSLAR